MPRKVRDTNLFNLDVFTPSQAGQVCGVSPHTVKVWIEKGELHSFTLPCGPYGNNRKVFRKDLLDFMTRNNIPLERLQGSQVPVVVVSDSPSGWKSDFYRILRENGALEMSPFDAGLFLAGNRPNAVVFDSSTGYSAIAEAVLALKARHPGVKTVLVCNEDSLPSPNLPLDLFDREWQRPFSWDGKLPFLFSRNGTTNGTTNRKGHDYHEAPDAPEPAKRAQPESQTDECGARWVG
jgi:hypothetical protein